MESDKPTMGEPNTKADTSFGSLFSNLTHEVTSLVRKEIELAKAELSEKASQATSGITSIAVAGAVLMSGFLVLLAAAVYGLNTVLPPNTTPWLSALIVGGIVVVIGFIMLKSGQKKLETQSLRPNRTMASVKSDQGLARQHGKQAKEQMK